MIKKDQYKYTATIGTDGKVTDLKSNNEITEKLMTDAGEKGVEVLKGDIAEDVAKVEQIAKNAHNQQSPTQDVFGDIPPMYNSEISNTITNRFEHSPAEPMPEGKKKPDATAPVINEEEAQKIAQGLNDGNAKNDSGEMQKLGVNIKSGAYADKDLSSAIAARAKGGFTQEEIDEIRAMSTQDKDGNKLADYIRDSGKGENYMKGVKLDEIQVPNVHATPEGISNER